MSTATVSREPGLDPSVGAGAGADAEPRGGAAAAASGASAGAGAAACAAAGAAGKADRGYRYPKGIASMQNLARGLYQHRATLFATGRAIGASLFGGQDAGAVDPATLGAVKLSVRPDADHARRFIAVTGGEPTWYERDGSVLLPPTYASTWGMQMLARLVAEGRLALPLARVLHVGNAVEIDRWPRAGEPIEVEARIASLDVKPSRTILTGRIEHRTPTGEALFTVTMTAFFPGGGGKKAERGQKPARPAEDIARVPFGAREIGRLKPTLALTRAYTAVSGDFNPVHVSDVAAKLLGFPRAFIHGYATKAFALSAVLREVAGGDPRRLRKADVRFKKPLLTGVEAGIFVGEGRAVDGAKGAVAYTLDVGPGPGEASYMTGEVELLA